MGGDHHHHEKVVIPDYRIYKVEDIPELVRVRDQLAKKGLKDPWLRNEVWRFDSSQWGTRSSRFKLMFARGIKWGLTAFAVTLAVEQVVAIASPPHDHHSHH